MDPNLRASDADRQRLVAALEEHTAAGRLTLDEFAERAAAAHRARTLGELPPLVADLPAEPPARARPSSAARAAVVVALALLILFLTGLTSVAAAGHAGMLASIGRMC